jgi:hypothetical protein
MDPCCGHAVSQAKAGKATHIEWMNVRNTITVAYDIVPVP